MDYITFILLLALVNLLNKTLVGWPNIGDNVKLSFMHSKEVDNFTYLIILLGDTLLIMLVPPVMIAEIYLSFLYGTSKWKRI